MGPGGRNVGVGAIPSQGGKQLCAFEVVMCIKVCVGCLLNPV